MIDMKSSKCKLNLNNLENFKYIGIRNFDKIGSYYYGRLASCLFYGSLKNNTDCFFHINDAEIRDKKTDSIFIGKDIDVNHIKTELIARGISESDIGIIDNKDKASLPIDDFNIHSFIELVSLNCIKNLYIDKSFPYSILWDFLLICINEVKDGNVKHLDFFNDDNSNDFLKKKYIELYDKENEIQNKTEKPEHYFDTNKEIFVLIADVVNMLVQRDIVIGKYNHYIVCIEDLNVRKSLTYLFRTSSLYQRSYKGEDFKNAFFCIDFDDFFVKGFNVPGCVEKNGFRFNMFLNKDFLSKEDKKPLLDDNFIIMANYCNLIIAKENSNIADSINLDNYVSIV